MKSQRRRRNFIPAIAAQTMAKRKQSKPLRKSRLIFLSAIRSLCHSRAKRRVPIFFLFLFLVYHHSVILVSSHRADFVGCSDSYLYLSKERSARFLSRRERFNASTPTMLILGNSGNRGPRSVEPLPNPLLGQVEGIRSRNCLARKGVFLSKSFKAANERKTL